MKKISCLRLRFLKMMQVIFLKVTILNWTFNNIINMHDRIQKVASCLSKVKAAMAAVLLLMVVGTGTAWPRLPAEQSPARCWTRTISRCLA